MRRQKSESSSHQASLKPPASSHNSRRWATPNGVAMDCEKKCRTRLAWVPAWRPRASRTVLIDEIVAEHEHVGLVPPLGHVGQVVGIILVVPIEVDDKPAPRVLDRHVPRCADAAVLFAANHADPCVPPRPALKQAKTAIAEASSTATSFPVGKCLVDDRAQGTVESGRR